MRMHSSQLVARLVVLLALGASVAQAQDAPAQAPAPTADARVERLLKEVAAEYTVDEDGDFRLVYDIGGGRSQLVWIPSGTSDFGSLEIRQIWSIAHRAQGATAGRSRQPAPRSEWCRDPRCLADRARR